MNEKNSYMNDDDFWDFAAFWEFFNPFNDKKEKEGKSTPKIIKKTYDINSLIRDLGSENNRVADAAQETLKRLGEIVIPLLIQALGNGKLAIMERSAGALIHIGKTVVNPVIEALKSENPEVRFYAAGVLQMLRDERAIEPLIKILKEEKNEKVRRAVSLALFAIKDPRVKAPLKQYGKEKGVNFVFEDEP
jgi:HEAT repeat protein